MHSRDNKENKKIRYVYQVKAKQEDLKKEQTQLDRKQEIDSKINIPISKENQPIFNGKYADNYAHFHEHVRSKINHIDTNYTTLGNVAKEKNYLFVNSEEINKIGTEFLRDFWAIPENRTATIINQNVKYKKAEYEPKNNQQEGMHPNCISFASMIINGKKCIGVAISGATIARYTHTQLIAFIEKYNKENAKKAGAPEFILLGNEQRNFNKLVSAISEKKAVDSEPEVGTTCTENIIATFHLKALLEGLDIFMGSVANFDFYPWERGKNYGSQYKSINKHVKPPVSNSETIDLKDKLNTFVTLKPCCEKCQKNKEPILKILKIAQNHALSLKKETIGEKKETLNTSPLLFSIKTNSTLTANQHKIVDTLPFIDKLPEISNKK